MVDVRVWYVTYMCLILFPFSVDDSGKYMDWPIVEKLKGHLPSNDLQVCVCVCRYRLYVCVCMC